MFGFYYLGGRVEGIFRLVKSEEFFIFFYVVDGKIKVFSDGLYKIYRGSNVMNIYLVRRLWNIIFSIISIKYGLVKIYGYFNMVWYFGNKYCLCKMVEMF